MAIIKKRSRGYLPHWELDGATYFVTFRLAGSLPKEALEQLRTEMKNVRGCESEIEFEEIMKIDRLLDSGFGTPHLSNPEIAKIVKTALLYFKDERYDLYAYCIMPNHVHTVFRPLPPHTLAKILHSWKSYSANQANAELGLAGAFWQKETFDRIIRDEDEFYKTIAYVMDNPAKAGLTKWPWVWKRE